MKINIGIKESHREVISEGLAWLLADTYTLYLKTHNFHWNVTGPYFSILHKLFEEQYNALALAVDEIAERIRTLGFPAPATYKQFAELSSIKETDGIPKAMDMVKHLVEGHEAVIRTLRAIYPAIEETGDSGTVALLDGRLEYHEKTAWMLRSHLA